MPADHHPSRRPPALGRAHAAAPAGQPDHPRKLGDRAVVIGGGIAGLLAASVLAEQFAAVTVLERDPLPAGPAARRGAPQSRHMHVLLAGGQTLLEALLPGAVAELTGAGACRLGLLDDVAWRSPAGWLPRTATGLELISASHALLEWVLRRRVTALAAVEIRHGEVTGLTTTSRDATAVTGVRLGPLGSRGQELDGALVVDASGRAAVTAGWLAAASIPPPPTQQSSAGVGYATRWYGRPRDHDGWEALSLQRAPHSHARGGSVFPVEGDRWVVTLTGTDRLPSDDDGFLAYAASLDCPPLLAALRAAQPVSPIWHTHATGNRWYRPDQHPTWPQRLLVLGDAACHTNPSYGQGITLAAQQAAALQACLEATPAPGDLNTLARRFHHLAARHLRPAWQLATGADRLASPAPSPLLARLAATGTNQVLQLATRHPAATRLLMEAGNLTGPPTRLLARMATQRLPAWLLPTSRRHHTDHD